MSSQQPPKKQPTTKPASVDAVATAAARRRLLQAVTVMVWAAVLAAGIGRFKLAAKPPFKVSLKTAPAQVKLSLDNQKLLDGRYVGTPYMLDLAPGKHRLKIARDGYVAHVVTVEGDSGDIVRMEDVVLEKNGAEPFGPVDIEAKVGEPEFQVEVDNGFHNALTPLITEDLPPDSQHTLEVFPAWPERQPSYRCRFRSPPADAEEPLILEISGKGEKLKVTNCAKLRKRLR